MLLLQDGQYVQCYVQLFDCPTCISETSRTSTDTSAAAVDDASDSMVLSDAVRQRIRDFRRRHRKGLGAAARRIGVQPHWSEDSDVAVLATPYRKKYQYTANLLYFDIGTGKVHDPTGMVRRTGCRLLCHCAVCLIGRHVALLAGLEGPRRSRADACVH